MCAVASVEWTSCSYSLRFGGLHHVARDEVGCGPAAGLLGVGVELPGHTNRRARCAAHAVCRHATVNGLSTPITAGLVVGRAMAATGGRLGGTGVCRAAHSGRRWRAGGLGAADRTQQSGGGDHGQFGAVDGGHGQLGTRWQCTHVPDADISGAGPAGCGGRGQHAGDGAAAFDHRIGHQGRAVNDGLHRAVHQAIHDELVERSGCDAEAHSGRRATSTPGHAHQLRPP